MSVVPLAWGGVVAVIRVELMTVTFSAATPPMVSNASVAKLDPATVIGVRPIDGPLEGEIDVTVGVGVGWTGVLPPQTVENATNAAMIARRTADGILMAEAPGISE